MFKCYNNLTKNVCFVTTAMFCNTAITYCLNLYVFSPSNPEVVFTVGLAF